MLGQLRVDPELELLPVEPELEPDDVLDEPELVLLDPVFPVFELEDGVAVDELGARVAGGARGGGGIGDQRTAGQEAGGAARRWPARCEGGSA